VLFFIKLIRLDEFVKSLAVVTLQAQPASVWLAEFGQEVATCGNTASSECAWHHRVQDFHQFEVGRMSTK